MPEQTSSEPISGLQSVTKGDRKKRIAKIFISLTVGVIFIILIKYKDTDSPVLAGGIAFETLNNSEFLIDEVEVKVIAEKDIIYP